jgi:D-threo-aldose 1-dehydrogenase
MNGSQLQPLGRCGVRVSRLGVGGGNLATSGGDRETTAMLDACWSAGLRYYDTAPLYGESEARLGLALAHHGRDDFVLSTKIGRLAAPVGERRFDFSRNAIERSLAESLLRLRTDYVDLLSVHDLTPAMLGDQHEQAKRDLLGGALDYLRALKKQGVFRALGIALYDSDAAVQLLDAASFDYVMIVGGYTLVCQSAADKLLPFCLARGIGVLLASPFHTGLLATGAVAGARFNYRQAGAEMLDKVARIEAVCDRHAVALPAAALQFPLLHPAIASVVVGHRTPREVQANLEWLETPAPQAFWENLVAEGVLPALTPLAPAVAGF